MHEKCVRKKVDTLIKLCGFIVVRIFLKGKRAMKNYHISKSKDGNGWELKKEGGDSATLKADTKAELVKATSDFMQGKEASVKIHKQDGTFQEERTYPGTSDPANSPG